MAKRKKAKSKAKRKKAPAKKPAARRKPSKLKKKVAKRKPVARRAPPKMPAARPGAPGAPAIRPAPAPRPAAPAAAPAPGAPEERVGVVTHYYSHLSVAVVRLESGSLRVGDTIHIQGHTSDFRQRVDSMQIEHESISEASAGDEFGLKVREHAREHDVVYKVGR